MRATRSGHSRRLGFGGRDIADGLEKAAFVEPVDPFEGGELDRFEAAPGAAPVDHLGFVEAVNGFGEGIVGGEVAVADAADRRLDPCLGKPLGILDRDVLPTAITVMDETAARTGRRWYRACSSASSTKPASADRETRQPTIRRAKTSITNAT